MGYIIVWRNSHKEPHIDLNMHSFKEEYSTYESAKEDADKIQEAEGPRSEGYFDYAIYKEVTS